MSGSDSESTLIALQLNAMNFCYFANIHNAPRRPMQQESIKCVYVFEDINAYHVVDVSSQSLTYTRAIYIDFIFP